MKSLSFLRSLLVKVIDNIDLGNCNYDEKELEQALELVSRIVIPETKYSKYQACNYLHISRATFDNWVREGKLPKGRKQQGFTELYWFKADLDLVKKC